VILTLVGVALVVLLLAATGGRLWKRVLVPGSLLVASVLGASLTPIISWYLD